MTPYRTSAAPLSTRWGATFWARLYVRALGLRVLWWLGVDAVPQRIRDRHVVRVRRRMGDIAGAREALSLQKLLVLQEALEQARVLDALAIVSAPPKPPADPPRAGNTKVRS